VTTVVDAAGVDRGPRDGLADVDGQPHYVIDDVDRMPPFLMSVVSDGDRWMFVSSSGALTAGRRDASVALFPYVTDDRLHSAAGQIGPVTRVRIETAHGRELWRPFAADPRQTSRRTVAKSVVGDSVLFEERHEECGLVFRYRWSSSDRFGFVRTATMVNESSSSHRVGVLDGLVDVMPYGLEPAQYQRLSNLTQAYKRSEVIDPDTRLAVFSLEAPVSDRAEPAEVLRATVAWMVGLDGPVSLSCAAVTAFESGRDVSPAHLVTGAPGAYLVHGDLELGPGEEVTWHLVADVGRDQFDVAEIRHTLRNGSSLADHLVADSRRTRERLVRIMAPADALQCTGDDIACAHHVANVTYNVMRGGVPLDGYLIDTSDFAAFVTERNRSVLDRHDVWLSELPDHLSRAELEERTARRVADTGDVHLTRLEAEYLPFSFSRRHGDPSRPWNEFSIRVADDAGRPVVYYEGNWRDVFQNWEALCASFPEYLPGVVSLFVNASTPDGYNPYRITRGGIDWELPDPADPWANIGYWGDHQIVYLLRLLEATDRFLPGEIGRRLTARVHTYADVPYRIVDYDDLVANPKATIRFDAAANARAERRVADIGGDGRLVVGADGEIVAVTLLEKLLVTALAKLSNYVPGAGIWMNTQRPEWNDANNALVGYGTSMVTLFHLRRFLDHLRTLVASHACDTSVSVEVGAWFDAVREVLQHQPTVPPDEADRHRRRIMDRLGEAASRYRLAVGDGGFSGATVPLGASAVADLCDAALGHLDATIESAWRSDGLVHSYNILGGISEGTATVEHLHEMLEGQVAAISCGVLSASRQADLLEALFASALYRPDQRSFMLAPADLPPAFVDKNVIDPRDVEANPLLAELVAAEERSLIRRDRDGMLRFAPDLTDEPALMDRLVRLRADERWTSLVERHRDATVATYEAVFRHRSHLGRSRSMHAYEGVGSIYWHMVTKLLLTVQEAASAAHDQGASPDVVERVVASYWRIRDGLGFCKSAMEFGAIPTDPYSHSPSHAGGQQPGMTGAVKEEILVRHRELGVRFDHGEAVFDSLLLRELELLDRPTRWTTRSLTGEEFAVDLPAGTLGFTICQVPVIVAVTDADARVEIDLADGRTLCRDGDRLGRDLSAGIIGRRGEVRLVRAFVRR
jgi:hypothetical protein